MPSTLPGTEAIAVNNKYLWDEGVNVCEGVCTVSVHVHINVYIYIHLAVFLSEPWEIVNT